MHVFPPKYRNIIWNLWIYFLIIFLNFGIGSWNVYSKYCVHYFSPMVVVGMRFILGAPLLFFLTMFAGNRFPKFKGLRDILTYFIAGTILYISQALYIIGLGYTSVSNGSILLLCIPVITTILSIILRIEGFHWQKILGLIVCSVGAILILSTAGFSFNNTMKGNILVIMSGFCFSVYVLFMQSRLLPRYKPLIVTSWCFFFGTIPATILTIFYFDYSRIFDVPILVWVSFIYGALLVTALGNLLYNWCLSRTSSVKVTSFSFVQPLTATVLAAFLLSEPILPMQVIGGIVITVGLILVLYSKEKIAAKLRKARLEFEKRNEIEKMNAFAEEREKEIEMQILASNLKGDIHEYEIQSETDANLDSNIVIKLDEDVKSSSDSPRTQNAVHRDEIDDNQNINISNSIADPINEKKRDDSNNKNNHVNKHDQHQQGGNLLSNPDIEIEKEERQEIIVHSMHDDDETYDLDLI